MNFAQREEKWQKVWQEQKVFEPEIDDRKKFLCTFPYPYVNGLPHVGHLFTMMRVEAFARYKRAKGYNVLFPQAWHATGAPIVTAANRVKEGDEKQIQILKDFGVKEEDIQKFSEPEFWIEYFVPNYKQDVQQLGMSIDWRREFVTTSLNPHYDAFIRWQFNTLKEKGYVQKGKHPVVWCPKDETPVSDHARRSGEGETPQEFLLVLFTLEDKIIPCATLRPETIDGLTNLWLNPNEEYVHAIVDGKSWVMSKYAADKLSQQEFSVEIKDTLQGEALIGKYVKTPTGKDIPILPATFVSMEKGTGIVMSVPSDAPDDYIAILDIKQNTELIKKYALEIENINPIPIISTQDLGNLPAIKVVEDMQIQSQEDRKKLEEAKRIVYKKGFYEGTMVAGKYSGQKVEYAKEKVKQDLLDSGDAYKLFELTGPVVCRCGTSCVIRVVDDQWFITYSDPDWKQRTHDALEDMSLYPEKSRQQFSYVIDWLNDWAATRERGLGTKLPWEEKWLIESLSDSTLYNSYYTFSHVLTSLEIEAVSDKLFDYVLLGKGEAKEKSWEEMRELFSYWYPVDFRNSGKDLIQNHLTFMLFIHTAIFEKENWPKGYGVNGWVTVDGQKMSKSLGNIIPVRDMLKEYGADASRLTIMNGGEGMDDPNWDSSLAQSTVQKMYQVEKFIDTYYNTGRDDEQLIDGWFESTIHRLIFETTNAMDEGLFRTALQSSWFEIWSVMKTYAHSTPRKDLMDFAIESFLKLIQPFMPHFAEELWQKIGHDSLISLAKWPDFDADKINRGAEAAWQLRNEVEADIKQVVELVDFTPKAATVIIASDWKYEFIATLKELLSHTNNPGELIKEIMLTDLKKHGQQITKMLPRFVKDRSKMPQHLLDAKTEQSTLDGATSDISTALGIEVKIIRENESNAAKASLALPGKPAIVLE